MVELTTPDIAELSKDGNGYFAAIEDPKKFAAEAYGRVEHFERTRQHILYRWHRNYLFSHNMYYQEGSPQHWGYSDIRYTGEQGEFATMSVNHFRNLQTHLRNMITASRVSFQCRSINGDAKSSAQTELANSLLDYYMREERLEEIVDDAVDNALLFDAGYIKVEWDPDAGEELTVDMTTNTVKHQGDLTFSSILPLDVITDFHKKHFRDNDWIIIRTMQSKWNLIARYPEHKTEIEGLTTLQDEWTHNYSSYQNESQSDDIYLYEFWHRKTPALPAGRYTLFTSDGNVFYDSPLHYKEIPIYQVKAGSNKATQFGYSPMNDVAGAQEALNMLYSTLLSILETMGVSSILTPREGKLTVEEIRAGLAFIEYDSQFPKPEGINFTEIPPEIMNFIDKLEQAQETISGVSSVIRGNPEASLRSGTAIAIIEEQALNFINHLKMSYVRLLEDVGRQTIDILKVFATEQRVFTIVGEANQAALREFKGEDLENISRVIVDLGSALARTSAGRIQIAQDMVSTGLISTPEEYLGVIETGNLEHLMQGKTNHLRLIHRENEDLINGKGAQAIITDDHSLHVRKHKELMDDPAMRVDSPELNAVVSHIQEHIAMMMNPELQVLFQVLGQQGLPPGPEAGGRAEQRPDTEQERAQAQRPDTATRPRPA